MISMPKVMNGWSIYLTFTPPESAPSGQFWGSYALIGGVWVNSRHVKSKCLVRNDGYVKNHH